MKYVDLDSARKIYSEGGNVTNFLRKQLGVSDNTPEIIEIAYDLQAGSYIEYLKDNKSLATSYYNELFSFIEPHFFDGCRVLDVGTGELTTFVNLLKGFEFNLEAYAFDVSWSRLFQGVNYFKNDLYKKPVDVFCSEMSEIPLMDNAIDFVISSHALEPNGKNLSKLLKELIRVANNRLILFEPSYELNSAEGKQRMDKLGYIKGIELAVRELGATLESVTPIKNVSNPLNPTACYIIKKNQKNQYRSDRVFSLPGENEPLDQTEGFYFSRRYGLAFPILDGIPVLKKQNAILATSYQKKP